MYHKLKRKAGVSKGMERQRQRQREEMGGPVTWLAGEAQERDLEEEHMFLTAVPDRNQAGMGQVNDFPLPLYLQLLPDNLMNEVKLKVRRLWSGCYLPAWRPGNSCIRKENNERITAKLMCRM